jgi:hypothetical protein
MYRIKTDIRQYKCESIDKVEKLIRNWVIRPNDLIYSSDDRDWLPIGEHPSFEKLFGILEEREAAEPDTVVTDDHPLLRNGTDVATNGEPEPNEATQITERPEFEDDDGDAMDSRETDIFDADQIAESLAERDRAEAEGAPNDEEPDSESQKEDAADSTDDETDQATTSAADTDSEPHVDDDETEDEFESPLAPPEPPEGVEPPVNDEITVMTDKTLEMMKVDEDGADDSDTPAEGDVPADDEPTNVTERPADDETTNVTTRPTDDEPDEPKVIVAAPEEPGTSQASKGVGRHDLPEEFFATNEISGPVFEESARVIDDLAAMEAEREARGENVDDEWDAISDNLDGAESRPALGLRDTDEIGRSNDRQDVDETPRDDFDDDDELIVDPLAETAIPAADEWDEDVSSVSSEDTLPGVAPEAEFVSDGYKMPLPFAVGPDEKDVALGLSRSKKSNTEKDAVFPYPTPKKRGEVHARVYYFSKPEPVDLSVPIVIGIVLVCAVIALSVAVC